MGEEYGSNLRGGTPLPSNRGRREGGRPRKEDRGQGRGERKVGDSTEDKRKGNI